ncbi:O-methyltransferase-domain-containing protein [Pseudoneurospora amorphoporcata]|uniref:O-methyltransferase-domain-containing protein n=1 Tax=Pseudoneurospora amorphoporcata TaxID=241081 RepID=A0AAN6NZF1_9PEZI|nr:O-methyltransferase-domain-containing protein [Pseudoneurospora amorphoporcata]
MASPKSNVSMPPTLEADNKNKSEDMESQSQSQSSFAPTPEAKSEDEGSHESQRKTVHDDNKSKKATEKATTSTATPTPSASPAFDLVKAAEDLLANAKKLTATLDSKPTDANHDAPLPPSPEEMILRQHIAKLGKKIALETGPPMAQLMSEMATVADTAAWNILLTWRAFDHIPLNGSISIADLARAIQADENLVSRFAGMLISTGKLIGSRPGIDGKENGPPTHISHSRISRLLRTNTSPATAAIAIVSFGNGMKGFAKWPEYFARHDRREPYPMSYSSDEQILVYESRSSKGSSTAVSSVKVIGRRVQDGNRPFVQTPFSLGWGHPDLAPWEVKALYPEYARMFEMAMAAKDKGAQGALGGDLGVGVYRGVNSEDPGSKFSLAWLASEAAARLGAAINNKNAKPSLVVDVGGGLGHFLANLLTEIPEIKPEQCILQDRPEVIAQVAKNMEGGDERLKGVKTMAHDFFNCQPEEAKGAAVYVLRRVLLDYCDQQAVSILERLRDALSDSGEGRIIIMEGVLLDKPTPENRLVDMVMMNLGGKLRNEEGYRKLCKAAGLKVMGYWVDVEGASCVVECVKEDGMGGSQERSDPVLTASWDTCLD